MLPYQLILAGIILAVPLANTVQGENKDTPVSIGTTSASVKTPKGFSLQGTMLTLPNGKTVDEVGGLQEVGKFILIVTQRSVKLYSPSHKEVVTLPLPEPYVTAYEPGKGPTPHVTSALPPTEYTLSLLPFDEAASNDKKASSKMAFICLKGAESKRAGIYRCQVISNKPVVEYLPIKGRGLVAGQHVSWNTFVRDVRGKPKTTEMMINMDRSEEPSAGTRHGSYVVERVKNGQDMITCFFPETPEQAAQRIAAHAEKIKANLEKRAVAKQSATSIPPSNGPQE